MNTPTPWYVSTQVGAYNYAIGNDDYFVAYMQILPAHNDDEANAALICRAVNSHQSLIDALDKLTEFATEGVAVPESWDVILNARAALALAKEPT